MGAASSTSAPVAQKSVVAQPTHRDGAMSGRSVQVANGVKDSNSVGEVGKPGSGDDARLLAVTADIHARLLVIRERLKGLHGPFPPPDEIDNAVAAASKAGSGDSDGAAVAEAADAPPPVVLTPFQEAIGKLDALSENVTSHLLMLRPKSAVNSRNTWFTHHSYCHLCQTFAPTPCNWAYARAMSCMTVSKADDVPEQYCSDVLFSRFLQCWQVDHRDYFVAMAQRMQAQEEQQATAS